MHVNDRTPRVTIGLPVYNGEKYLAAALDSLLAQTYANFELIISDNASTDGTEGICRGYMEKDRRLSYHRTSTNIGGCRNQNRLVALASGEFFMWAHHDDRRAPEYLERCVQVLDAQLSVVLCYSKTRVIDETGRFLEKEQPLPDISPTSPQGRFARLIRLDYKCDPVLGLFRTSVLKRTALFGLYPDHDRVLLSELALHGPFHEIPEPLFFRREHSLQSTAIYPGRQERLAWCDPEKTGKLVFPYFREGVELIFAINRVRLPWYERLCCYREVVKWCARNRSRLTEDVLFALGEMARPSIRQLKKMMAVRG
jgi:glycosyltransferase involved in cell wall biosynthesis